MKDRFQFQKITDINVLAPLKTAWRNTLTAPEDGMWETFTEYANHWEILNKNQRIGYACVNDENLLLQFYVLPNWLNEGAIIFKQFIQQQEIKRGMIGTNNPILLSIAMHFQKQVKVDTYLFSHFVDVSLDAKEGVFNIVKEGELERLVDFYHQSMDAPKDWLRGYLGDLVSKGEVFSLENNDEILGACEVRKSKSNPKVADLGMVVSANHRRQGLGTFLLGKAKEIAIRWNRKPICSCEKDNIGSSKSIQNNGFRSIHQMLLVEF